MNTLPTETIQLLLTEARFLDTKPPELHDMSDWIQYAASPCCTTRCAVGDMIMRGDIPRLSKLSGDDSPWTILYEDFKISGFEAEFLFAEEFFIGDGYLRKGYLRERTYESPKQTAARIRKYVYYKLHKADILSDYETARRREGNWNVCPQVLEKVGLEVL